MKGAFVVNRYYVDEGADYVFSSLKTEFAKHNIELVRCAPSLIYDGQDIKLIGLPQVGFVIFWDKNVNLARQIENTGLKVFNCAHSIAVCDDKQHTYAALALSGEKIKIPKTICAPLMYNNCTATDSEFLQLVEAALGYPVIAKQNTGSQGRQVYLAKNATELTKLYKRLKHTNHHYQQLTGTLGEDLRLYMVGGEVAASYIRKGTGFKSNLFNLGTASRATPCKNTINLASRIANLLKLDFGAIDFLINDNEPIFLEANSNAYFQGAQKLGFKVAQRIALTITQLIKNS